MCALHEFCVIVNGAVRCRVLHERAESRTSFQLVSLLSGQVGNWPHDAEAVTVTPGTALRADALGSGTGGHVVVWSDQTTAFDGAVSARGGVAGGTTPSVAGDAVPAGVESA